MTTDLFDADPANRIAELEQENTELKQALKRMIADWDSTIRKIQQVYAATEDLGESQEEARRLLNKLEARP